MTVDEVTDLLHCHRITLLRLIGRGALHIRMVAHAMRFERAEVAAINNRRIAVYPHLILVTRAGLARRAWDRI